MPQEAINFLYQAVAVFQCIRIRRFDFRRREAETLRLLGDLLRDNGQPTAAAEYWRQALAIYNDLDVPQAVDVAARLSR